MSDIKFIVNEKERIVICKLLNCSDIPWGRILKYTDSYWMADMTIKDTYTGIARCSAEDEWDEEYGKQLALTRAKRKRAIAINAVLNKFIKKTRYQLDVLERYGIHRLPELEE